MTMTFRPTRPSLRGSPSVAAPYVSDTTTTGTTIMVMARRKRSPMGLRAQRTAASLNSAGNP